MGKTLIDKELHLSAQRLTGAEMMTGTMLLGRCKEPKPLDIGYVC